MRFSRVLLVIFAFLVLTSVGQGCTLVMNPITGLLDCVGVVTGGTGTVTSISGSGPAWLTWAISNPTTNATITLTPTTAQTSHQVIGTCNTATTFAPCLLVAGDIPAIPISTGISGLGTGIATALGVNTGSAGAPVLFNGAGGAPTSLDLTNATKTPITLTTTGTSGAATYTQATQTLNIPQYVAGGGTGNAASVVTTTFSATPTFTCPSATAGTVTTFELSTALTANITSSTLATCTSGQILVFVMAQDATGGRTVAWPTGFSQAAQPSPIASSVTKITFAWDGTTAELVGAAADRGPSVCSEIAAPAGNPPSGSFYTWCDSTDHQFEAKNSSGTVYKLGSSALTIGSAVTGGNANSLLFEDGSSNLASTVNLLFQGSGNQIDMLNGGNRILEFYSGGGPPLISFNSAGVLTWGNSTTAITTRDTGLSRDSAGVIDVGNATGGDTSGSMKMANLSASGLAAHGPLIGEGTSNIVAASPGTSGQCYLSNGASTDPSFQACPGGSGAGNSVTSTTPVTVNTNTTSDQQLMELSLGAGYFNSSKQPFLFDGAGVYTTQTAQTPTITLKIKLCTVSGCGSGTVVTLISIVSTATIAAVTNNNWNLSVLGYTATTGATGNLEIHGPLAVDLGALTTTADSIFVDTNTAVSSNIDLTAALFVDFTIAFSTNAATANTFTQRSGGVMPFAATAAPVTSVNTNTGAVTLFNVNAQTTTYQVLASDFSQCKTITVASGTFTITLVASGTQPANGQCIKVINYGSGVVTIARSGQNINGGTASYVLESSSATNPSTSFVFSDGTNYFISGGFTNPMTTAGDIMYAGTTGLPTRLATGTANAPLLAGSPPVYASVTAPTGVGNATLAQVIASGTSALGTSAISSGACATVVTTTATGTATTDDFMADFNADPTGVTGYAPSANGMLTIIKYPTANNVNFKVCNNTSSSITPGAITLNWRVVR